MRLIMFGTGPFAVPTFEALLESDHEVLALVTRPIADSGRRRKSSENPSRDAADAIGLPVLDPLDVNADDSIDALIEYRADLFVVCDYGQILSRDCLAASKLGGINLHGSLLPKYRGAAPINWAIFNGDPVTGITIIHMTARLDGGPCLVQAKTKIEPGETAEQIEPRLANLGVQPVLQSIDLLNGWDGVSNIGSVQDPSLATRAPRLKKTDGAIDWSRSAREISDQIRAFQPWPGSYTVWNHSGFKQPMRLIIHRVTIVDDGDESDSDTETEARHANRSGLYEPGQISVSEPDRLIIQTGQGELSIDIIQPAGKRAMPIQDFLRGNAPAVGDNWRVE